LVLSVINNWEQNPEANMEEAGLFVKTITGRWWMMKRLRPAPQGRAHRIRKRSNHVTIVGAINNTQAI
jgi:large subunit ribosomal protein L22